MTKDVSDVRGSGKAMSHKARAFVLYLLRGYKWAISPMCAPACRYVPTCSEYAMEAVDRYGLLRGGWMAMKRVLSCHPFVKGGYDPVVKVDDYGTSQGAVAPASCVVAE
jgi:putative membrane protein insertion efficiency factor